MCFWNFLLPDLKWPPARLLRSPSSMRTIQGRLWRKFRLDFWNIFFLYLLTGQAGLILPPKGSLSMADLLRFCLNYKKNKCEIGEWLQIGERNKGEKNLLMSGVWCSESSGQIAKISYFFFKFNITISPERYSTWPMKESSHCWAI